MRWIMAIYGSPWLVASAKGPSPWFAFRAGHCDQVEYLGGIMLE